MDFQKGFVGSEVGTCETLVGMRTRARGDRNPAETVGESAMINVLLERLQRGVVCFGGESIPAAINIHQASLLVESVDLGLECLICDVGVAPRHFN